jgi:multiple sugar transport system permease protein
MKIPMSGRFFKSTDDDDLMKKAGNILVYCLLGVLALSMLIPFLWMLSTSLMDELEVYQFPPRFIPAAWKWANFSEAMTLQPFARFFLNTMIVAAASVIGQLTFCSMAAYAFARLQFRWREKIFALYLGTMMIPAIVTIIPAFLIITSFGWMNTYWALFTPTISSVWGIFLLRQFFLTIPRDLEDAARVDGASEFTIFLRVILPLSKPALATLAIFAFIGSWKDFLWPLIVTNRVDMRTVEVGIANFSNLYTTDWPHQMAAAVVVMVPIVIVFMIAQKYFVKGITMTGLKG